MRLLKEKGECVVYLLKLLKNLILNVAGRSKQYPERLLKEKGKEDGKEKGELQCRPQCHAGCTSNACLPLSETELLS